MNCCWESSGELIGKSEPVLIVFLKLMCNFNTSNQFCLSASSIFNHMLIHRTTKIAGTDLKAVSMYICHRILRYAKYFNSPSSSSSRSSRFPLPSAILESSRQNDGHSSNQSANDSTHRSWSWLRGMSEIGGQIEAADREAEEVIRGSGEINVDGLGVGVGHSF